MLEKNTATEAVGELPVSRGERRIFIWAVMALVAGLFVFHLTIIHRGYWNYRDQHLGAVLEYAKGKIDLRYPVVVGFNANNVPTPQELPVWQATTAVCFKCFGTWFGWANIVSLLFALATLWPVFDLARRYAGERTAWWALLLLICQPLFFYYSGRGGTDGSCLTFVVWFVWFADALLRSGEWRWFGPCALFGALSAVTKSPFFFCAGLTAFFLLLLHGRGSLRRWLLLAGVGFFCVAVFAVWTRHTNVMLARAEFPFVDLRLSGGSAGNSEMMSQWYFGDWHYRFNPANWLKGGWRFLNAELGSFALVALLASGFFGAGNRLAKTWFAAGALTTLAFSHLVLHHHHYYLMFGPAVAMLGGAGAARLDRKFSGVNPAVKVFAAVVVLGLCVVQGLIGMKVVLDADPYPRRMAEVIRAHTAPDDRLLVAGGGWGGEEFIRSDRRGLSIWSTEFLEKPENLRRIRELGFNKLIMISASPLLTALQQINPGQADFPRETYEALLTPVARDWPVQFQTPDIVIKEIPK